MSSHEDGGQLHGTKTKKKKRASLNKAADIAPKAKKQKHAAAEAVVAGTPGANSIPPNDAVVKNKGQKKKRKAVDGEKQTSVRAAEEETGEQQVTAPKVSRKEAKLQRKLAATNAAGALASAEAEELAHDSKQSVPARTNGKKGKKRKAAEALETVGVAATAGVAATEGAPEAGACPAGSTPAKNLKRKKVKHVQQDEAAAQPLTENADAAASADPAVGNKQRKKMRKQQSAAATGAAGGIPAAISAAALETDERPPREDAGAMAAPGSSSGAAEGGVPQSAGNKSGDKAGKARSFQRVNADEWLNKKGAWDNSYEATFGNGGWGAGAQAVLGQVRGKDFRHEKTKKKRGTYRGGQIDHHVNSFKFESDDE